MNHAYDNAVSDAGLPSAVLDALRQELGERITTAPSACEQHGRDESYHPARAAQAVVFPDNDNNVSHILRRRWPRSG